MFRCQKCGKNVPANQPLNTIVAERRQKTYEVERKRNDRIWTEQATGWEIVKVLDVCPECYTEFTGEQARLKIEQEKVETQKESVKDFRKERQYTKYYNERRKPQVEIIKPLQARK